MGSTKRIGRVVGLLILVQLAIGLLVMFGLLQPLTTPTDFLDNAAGSSFQLGVAGVLWFALGALTLGVAVAAWPVFHQHGPAMALWFLSSSVVAFALLAVESSSMMSMVSLGRDWAAAGGPESELFDALGAAVRARHDWAFLASALIGELTILVHYGILYRFALIPRTLSALGLVTVALKIAALTRPFFGHRALLPMIVPQPVIYLALALWLMAKGFEERAQPESG